MKSSMTMLSFDEKAEKKVEVAIVHFISFLPIYGTVFLALNKKCTTAVSTMGIGMSKDKKFSFFFNPELVNRLSSSELRAELKHEAGHILLNHLFRAKDNSLEHKRYNIAADLSMNPSISGLPKGCLYPEQYELPDHMSSEFYYDSVKDDKCPKCGKGDKGSDGKGGGCDNQSSTDGEEGDGEHNCGESKSGSPESPSCSCSESSGSDGEVIGSHDMWKDVDPDGLLREKIRTINREAIRAQSNRGWGDIPAGFAEQVIAANKSVVNWKRNIRYFIGKLVRKGRASTRMKPNRRFGYEQPGVKKGYVSKILIGVDMSGSISESDASDFMAELNAMIKYVNCDVITFDTDTYGKPKSYKKRSSIEWHGGGGTDFDPVFRMVEALKYDGVIMFTDGFAPFPEPPVGTKVLWALTKSGESVTPPYGRIVVIDK